MFNVKVLEFYDNFIALAVRKGWTGQGSEGLGIQGKVAQDLRDGLRKQTVRKGKV